jgi:hypothetical protein
MHEAHWGSRAWQKNLDETTFNPEHPQAFPAARATDLMGRIRVRISAENDGLVAYGFGGQRIAIHSSEIGAVRTASAYRTGGPTRSQALLVFDKADRILLRAAGLWETYGEVARVCRVAKAPAPTHVSSTYVRTASGRSRSGRTRTRRVQQAPRYQKAHGYRRLRTRPRGATLRLLAVLALFIVAIAIPIFIGLLPALFLPDWIGKVRVLIGVVGAAVGFAAGLWLFAAVTHFIVDGLRWAIASIQAAGFAPPDRFFRWRGSESDKWSGFLTLGLFLMVPLLVIWGPGLALVSGIHGVTDSNLAGDLRANGVQTQGALIDVPSYSTDSNGDTTVTDVPTLSFRVTGQTWQDTDPSIGGRPLPLDAGDPDGTDVPLTIVYDPDNPNTAAALQQITGSVWHGAPTANVISGTLLTAVLPFWIWWALARARRRKFLRNADLLEGITTAEG